MTVELCVDQYVSWRGKTSKVSWSPSSSVLFRNRNDEADFGLRMKLRNLDLVEHPGFYTVKCSMISYSIAQDFRLTEVDTMPRTLDIELLQNRGSTRVIRRSLGKLAWLTPSLRTR